MTTERHDEENRIEWRSLLVTRWGRTTVLAAFEGDDAATRAADEARLCAMLDPQWRDPAIVFTGGCRALPPRQFCYLRRVTA